MLIKNISELNIDTISVTKDVCYLLIDAGYHVVNVEDNEYFFIKTDNLCEFLESEGVSID